MLAGELSNAGLPDRGHGSGSQIGILRSGLEGVDQAAQMMHPDAKVPFLGPAPRGIQFPLIIRDRREMVGQQRL